MAFFDSDMFPISSSGSGLRTLWNLPLDNDGPVAMETVNAGCKANGCFNSGLMLLRPNSSKQRRILDVARREASNSGSLMARCPAGGPKNDQPVLNAAFPSFEPLPQNIWHVTDPWQLKACESLRAQACDPQTLHDQSWLERGASFHFLASTREHAPWQHRDCDSTATATVHTGDSAKCTIGIPGHRVECTLPGFAMRQWWDTLARLDRKTQQACRAGLELERSSASTSTYLPAMSYSNGTRHRWSLERAQKIALGRRA